MKKLIFLLLGVLGVVALFGQVPDTSFRATALPSTFTSSGFPDADYQGQVLVNLHNANNDLANLMAGDILVDGECNFYEIKNIQSVGSGVTGLATIDVAWMSNDVSPFGFGVIVRPSLNGALIGPVMEASEKVNECLFWYNTKKTGVRVEELASVGDTSTIVGPIESDIAMIGGSILLIYDGERWLEFEGGGGGGSSQNWDDLFNVPAGFADGIDDVGVSQQTLDDSTAVLRADLAGAGGGTDDQVVDEFQILSNILRLSLESDGEAAKEVSLAAYLDNTDAQNLSGNFNTGTNTLTIDISNGSSVVFDLSSLDGGAGLTNEEIEDIVGAMLSGTEYNITVDYDDPNGLINFDVDLSAYVTIASTSGWDTDASDDFDGTWPSLTGVPADLLDGDDVGITSEADPAFTASIAAAITGIDTANWNAAYNSYPTALAFSGTTTKTLTITLRDGNVITGTFQDLSGAGGDGNDFATSAALNGTTLEISVTNQPLVSVNLAALQDGTGTDDQQLSIDSVGRVFTLALEDGGSVVFEDTNTQLTEAEVDAFVNNNGYISVETDPSFTASPANGITGPDIANWDEAYDKYPTGVAFTGTTTKTLTVTLRDGSTLTGNFNDLSGAGGDGNDFLTAAVFNPGTGEITLSINNQPDVIVDISALDTDTDDQTIDEFQILSNVLRLSLENDGEAAQTVSLAAYLDNTDAQSLSGGYNPTTNELTVNLANGGSVVYDLSELDDVDTDTQLSDEQVQDIIGAMLSGTQTNITVSYDDPSGNIDFVVDLSAYVTIASTSAWDKNAADDFSGSFNDLTNVPPDLADGDDIGSDDQTVDEFQIISNILRLSLESDGEAAQTVSLASYLDNTDSQSLSGNYNATSNVLTVNLTNGGSVDFDLSELDDANTQLTQEQVQDFVGSMVLGNTETNITVTYDDANDEFDFVVDLSAYLTIAATSGWDTNAADDFDGTWGSLSGVPADLLDGDDVGTDSQTLSSSWNPVSKQLGVIISGGNTTFQILSGLATQTELADSTSALRTDLAGGGDNIGSADLSLSGNRVLDLNGNSLYFEESGGGTTWANGNITHNGGSVSVVGDIFWTPGTRAGVVTEDSLVMKEGNGRLAMIDPERFLTDLAVIRAGGDISDLNNNAGYITSESDPVFSASIAGGIVAQDITDWDLAYGRSPTGLSVTGTTTKTITLTRATGAPLTATFTDDTGSALTGDIVVDSVGFSGTGWSLNNDGSSYLDFKLDGVDLLQLRGINDGRAALLVGDAVNTFTLPFGFISDPRTGLYKLAGEPDGRFSILTNGDAIIDLYADHSYMRDYVWFEPGSAAQPSISNTSNYGIFWSGSTVMGIGAGGVQRGYFQTISTDAFRLALKQFSSGGTADNSPAFTFDGDEDTGVYRYGDNVVGLTGAGSGSLLAGDGFVYVGSTPGTWAQNHTFEVQGLSTLFELTQPFELVTTNTNGFDIQGDALQFLGWRVESGANYAHMEVSNVAGNGATLLSSIDLTLRSFGDLTLFPGANNLITMLGKGATIPSQSTAGLDLTAPDGTTVWNITDSELQVMDGGSYRQVGGSGGGGGPTAYGNWRVTVAGTTGGTAFGSQNTVASVGPTPTNVSYNSSNGEFTVLEDGMYTVDVDLFISSNNTTQFNIRVNVNGTEVWTAPTVAHSAVDPVERSTSLLLDLVNGDDITVTYSTAFYTTQIGSTMRIIKQ